MDASVLERLERLERQNRGLKRAGLIVMVLAAATLLIGQAALQWKVEAQSFVLKDENGKVRAELGMAGHGPLLALYDEDGAQRAVFGIAERGPGLFFLDSTQRRRAAFGVVGKGPVLILFDEDGKTIFSKP